MMRGMVLEIKLSREREAQGDWATSADTPSPSLSWCGLAAIGTPNIAIRPIVATVAYRT